MSRSGTNALKGKTYEEIYGKDAEKQRRKRNDGNPKATGKTWKLTDENKKNQSEARKGVPSKLKDRTYEEIYGEAKAKELREKRRLDSAKNYKPSFCHTKPHTEESKRKNSEACKKSYENGRKVWNEGLTKEIDERVYGGESHHFYGEDHSGVNSSTWSGGISFEPYSYKFNFELKKEIRRRDAFTCQFCGVIEKGRRHSVHHIDYNKKNCSKINLITICLSCNSKANASREKWQLCFEILQEIRREN